MSRASRMRNMMGCQNCKHFRHSLFDKIILHVRPDLGWRCNRPNNPISVLAFCDIERQYGCGSDMRHFEVKPEKKFKLKWIWMNAKTDFQKLIEAKIEAKQDN